MKKCLFALAALSLLMACTPEENGADNNQSGNGNDPSVTIEAKNVSAISAVLAGKANLGSTGASDLNVGFQYSKSAGILPQNSVSVDAEDVDPDYNYTAPITGLEPATKYYFRSFVRQNGQDTYGKTMEFTTKDVTSLLETKEASGVEATMATLNAKLDLSDVLYNSLAYGFLWGTSEAALNTDYKCTEISDNAISAALTNLSHKTQYWCKSYVTLDSQTFYGEVKTFTTDVVPVESVSLDKTEYTFNTIGNTLTLKATVLPADATDNSVEWSSDKEDVAAVDANGRVTAKGNGKATITVTAKDGNGAQATCEVEVKQYVTSVSLDKSSLVLEVGNVATLSVASVLPNNANDKSYTWSSSDSSIASVDNSGKVTARANGNATIKATANDGSGVFASCSVFVFAEKVDMGLKTSGGKTLYWSTRNLCESGFVNSPEEYGDYYAWGETAPYYSSQSPLTWKKGKTGYNWASYKWCNGSSMSLTKYNNYSLYGSVVDKKQVLEPEDDVAHVKLGGKWRMPTNAEWSALKTKCKWTWTTLNGVDGMLVTAANGNSIFLPAAGSRTGNRFNKASVYGSSYWSSSLNNRSEYAYFLEFDSDEVRRDATDRCFGYSVRPVSE